MMMLMIMVLVGVLLPSKLPTMRNIMNKKRIINVALSTQARRVFSSSPSKTGGVSQRLIEVIVSCCYDQLPQYAKISCIAFDIPPQLLAHQPSKPAAHRAYHVPHHSLEYL